LPVVNALKRHDPVAHLTWVLEPGPASLVRGHLGVDATIEIQPGAAGLLAARRALANQTFDLVLDLQVALKAGLVTAFVRSPRKVGFDRARARDLNWVF